MLPTDDYFLKALADFAEKGLSLPIIVSVGGATIEGILISEDEYFQLLSELVRADTSASPEAAEQAEALREVLSGMPNAMDEAVMSLTDEGANPEDMPSTRKEIALTCIHLRDTRIMLPDGDFIGLSAPWRGRRSAVDGFWLGEADA